jgi:hypothetical protein
MPEALAPPHHTPDGRADRASPRWGDSALARPDRVMRTFTPSPTHEGRLHSIPRDMKGTFTPTYRVKVHFIHLTRLTAV